VSDALRLFVAVFLRVRCVPAQSPAPEAGAKPIVLQKNDGDLRTRRPREGVASPSSDFLLKIGPKTSGSTHLRLYGGDPARRSYPEAQAPRRGRDSLNSDRQRSRVARRQRVRRPARRVGIHSR
jgi:hypothetical protein